MQDKNTVKINKTALIIFCRLGCESFVPLSGFQCFTLVKPNLRFTMRAKQVVKDAHATCHYSEQMGLLFVVYLNEQY